MKTVMTMALVGFVAVTAGCGTSQIASGPEGEDAAGGAADSQFLVTSEPAGALPVGEARQNVRDDQAVTLVGLIGGSSKPFVDGLAAFTIVDPKVPYCADDEGCPTPWDYCCKTEQVKDSIATVKIVDDSGKPVASDARSLLNVQELATVVVQGKAKRDDQGNLSVLAHKVFVRPRTDK